jgi:hypothetical protein
VKLKPRCADERPLLLSSITANLWVSLSVTLSKQTKKKKVEKGTRRERGKNTFSEQQD